MVEAAGFLDDDLGVLLGEGRGVGQRAGEVGGELALLLDGCVEAVAGDDERGERSAQRDLGDGFAVVAAEPRRNSSPSTT